VNEKAIIFCQYNILRMEPLRQHQFYSISLEFVSDIVRVYTTEEETAIEYTQVLRKNNENGMLQRWAKFFDNTIDVNCLTDKQLNSIIQNKIDFFFLPDEQTLAAIRVRCLVCYRTVKVGNNHRITPTNTIDLSLDKDESLSTLDKTSLSSQSSCRSIDRSIKICNWPSRISKGHLNTKW
jgi:hypothetical protein